MILNEYLPIVLLACSLIMSLAVALRAWRYRDRPIGKAFFTLIVALMWWLLCAIIENTSADPDRNTFWMRMSYLGITTVPVMWLVFTLHYTEKGVWWRRYGILILLIVPVITNVIIWTNGLHHLMWQDIQFEANTYHLSKVVSYNIWFWVHALYSYMLIVIGTFYLFNLYFRTSGIFRKQVGVMLVAAFIPWIANGIFIIKIFPTFTIDPTPMAFVITCLAFYWGFSRTKLLNIMPIAYEAIFKSISDGVIVINEQNRIQEINPATAQILQANKSELFDKKLCQVIPAKAYSAENISNSSLTETVISLGENGTRRYFKINVSPIFNERRVSGRLVLLHDDTERRKAENESREKVLLKTELNERKMVEQVLTDYNSRLQSLSEESPAIICNVDLKGQFIYVNKKFEEVSGYRRQEILNQNAFTSGLFSNDVSLLLQERMKAKIEGKRTEPLELQFIRKDQVRIWLSIMAEPIRENDAPTGFQIIGQDVTEHKKMEEAQANEAIWRRILIEQSRDGIVILDHNGKVYEANRCFCEMLGYSPEEMSKLYIWDWDTESTRENLMMKINNINEAGDNFEANYRRKDSTIISVDISTNGATFAGEKLILYVCRDITERKRIEDKLRKSEEKYRMIFASANDVIILTDKKGNIVDVNEKISNIGGYHRDDLIGKSFKTLTKVMPKKSIAIVAKNYALRLLGIHVPAYEVEMYHSDGQLINIEINAVAVKEDNKIIGTLATLRDVTERKKSESALKYERELIEQIIATIPNAVIVIDDDTRVLLANNTFYKSFHLKKKDVEDRPINESIRIEELDHTLKTLVKTKQNNTSLEIRYPVNNAPRILATGIIKMENQRYLIIMNDITEEREKQERLYLTDRLASVGEMASGVAHELNNPLTSVIGLSSFLMKQEMPSDTHEDLAAINSEAQRCAVIVKNLLTFARKHVPKREQIQLTKILEDVLKLRAYEQRGQNINIETYFAPDLPDVLADYFQIQQVFLNIILNAEAAMVEAHSRGTLKIKMERLGNHVEISFADDGPGILQENMGLIFNPFFTTKEVGKGTGLGLSICYGIITSHGGKIYAKSTPGSGATFVIELPCA